MERPIQFLFLQNFPEITYFQGIQGKCDSWSSKQLLDQYYMKWEDFSINNFLSRPYYPGFHRKGNRGVKGCRYIWLSRRWAWKLLIRKLSINDWASQIWLLLYSQVKISLKFHGEFTAWRPITSKSNVSLTDNANFINFTNRYSRFLAWNRSEWWFENMCNFTSWI